MIQTVTKRRLAVDLPLVSNHECLRLLRAEFKSENGLFVGDGIDKSMDAPDWLPTGGCEVFGPPVREFVSYGIASRERS